MPRQRLFEVGKGVTGDPKSRSLDIMRVFVKPGLVRRQKTHKRRRDLLIRVQQNLAQLLVLQHLLEHHARVERDLLILIPRERRKDDVRLRRQILDSGPPRANLSSEEVVEYLHDVLPGLKLEPRDALH